MFKIHFIDSAGEQNSVTAEDDETVMEAAVRNAVPGIDGDCGGACACATCHVYVDEAWVSKLASPDDTETTMLEFAETVRENSRLSCQIRMSSALDGLTVTTPETQG